jgi:hypothetical protein
MILRSRKETKMKSYRVWKVLKGIVFVVVVAVALGFVVRELWNSLVPGLFHGPLITYWQALGLFVLSKILFGGFHRHGGGGGGRWRQEMREKWEQMSPEEREKLRAGMGRRGAWCDRSPVEPRV